MARIQVMHRRGPPAEIGLQLPLLGVLAHQHLERDRVVRVAAESAVLHVHQIVARVVIPGVVVHRHDLQLAGVAARGDGIVRQAFDIDRELAVPDRLGEAIAEIGIGVVQPQAAAVDERRPVHPRLGNRGAVDERVIELVGAIESDDLRPERRAWPTIRRSSSPAPSVRASRTASPAGDRCRCRGTWSSRPR